MEQYQWSKSYEFENLFRGYLKTYINENISYFSLLRNLHEIKIIKLFAKYPKYFTSFSSCNRNFRIQEPLSGKNWCAECPKCVFVFILLSAFISREKLINIFGKNLYDNQSLLSLTKELLGIEAFKPFECVGTPEETKLAMYYACKSGNYKNTAIMKFFQKDLLDKLSIQKLEQDVFQKTTGKSIPAEFKNVMKGI